MVRFLKGTVGLLSAWLFLTYFAIAQTPPIGVCKADVAETISNGLIGVVPFASVKVCAAGNSAASCLTDMSVANLYTTPALNVTTTNPQITDAGGNWYFCLPVGHYGIEVVAGVGNFFIPDTTFADDWSKGGYVTGNWHVSGTIFGNVTGVVTGSVVGNASTASAALTPGSACNPATQFAYGVDGTWNALCHSLPPLGAQYYQVVAANGVGQTQRPTLNFTPQLAVTDSSSPQQTNIDLATSGVSAGTYTGLLSIQVDAYGRVVNLSTVTPITGTMNVTSQSLSSNTCYSQSTTMTAAVPSGKAVLVSVAQGSSTTAELAPTIENISGATVTVTWCNSWVGTVTLVAGTYNLSVWPTP